MPVLRFGTLPTTVTSNKTSGTALAGGALGFTHTIEDGDMLVVAMVSDNQSNLNPFVGSVSINTVENPGGTIVSTRTYAHGSVSSTAGSSAQGSITVCDLSALAGQTIASTGSAYTANLTQAVQAKATSAYIVRGSDFNAVSMHDQRNTTSAAFTLPSLSGVPATSMVSWLVTTESATAPTMSGVSNNSTVGTSGGSGTSNVAGRWAYFDDVGAGSRTATTSTRGGSIAIILPEKVTAPPSSAALLCGIPI